MRFFASLLLLGCLIFGMPGMVAQNIGPIATPPGGNGELYIPPKPLEEALPELREHIVHQGGSEHEDFLVLKILQTYPDIEELIASEIAMDIASGKSSNRLFGNFVMLARLRTSDALKIIGLYLYDDRALSSSSSETVRQIPSTYASAALTQMKLAKAPTRVYGWGRLSDEQIDAWRVWWEENKDNLEAALNLPGEAQTPPPQAPGTGPNLPLRSEASSPEEEKAPSTPDAANLNVPALLLVVLGTLLAAIAAILLHRGRK